MLKAKNVTIHKAGGLDGYVNADASGMVKTVIDSFDLTPPDRVEFSSDGLIIASLEPEARIIDVHISNGLSQTLTANVGTTSDTGNIMVSNTYDANGAGRIALNADVSTRKLGAIATEAGDKPNSDGLIDIILVGGTVIDATGNITVMIQYI